MIHIWSAIYGDYDKPKPLRILMGEFSGVLWTDRPSQIAEGWYECNSPLTQIPTPMLKAKAWKTINPSKYIQDGSVFIWLDGSMTVTDPNLIAKCIEALGEDDASFMPHPWRSCLFEEGVYSLQFDRYRNCGIGKQMEVYRNAGIPPNCGLIATGFFVIRMVDWTRKLLADWWEECLKCHQDQISLPFLLWQSQQTRWNLNLPWEAWFTRSEHLK